MNSAIDTRERILDAAADILETEGLAKLNTNAIAERAGVTPPTVYRNFENKEEVVGFLARRFIEAERAWLSAADASRKKGDNLKEAVELFVDLYWESARKHRGIVALRSAMRVWPALRALEEESLQSSSSVLAGLLATYQSGRSPRQLARIARYIVETVCSTIDRCYLLSPSEQSWRIRMLKEATTAYLSSHLTNR